MVKNKGISKTHLYESVKTLVETPHNHIHLPQHKLFTLFSIAFQYLLFLSTKQKGHYLVRIEDHFLADKLTKKAKDDSTKKFLEKIVLQRKLRYGESTFILDYFHIGTWSLINEVPQHKIKGALIVKDTVNRPLKNDPITGEQEEAQVEEDENLTLTHANLGKNYFLTSLQSFIPKTIIVAFNESFENTDQISFPFIKDQEQRVANGVTLANDIKIDDLD